MPQIADLSKIPAPDVIEEIDFEKIRVRSDSSTNTKRLPSATIGAKCWSWNPSRLSNYWKNAPIPKCSCAKISTSARKA